MIDELYGNQETQIGAQLYLKRFYQSFGFEPCSDIYLEDDIEHILMLRAAQVADDKVVDGKVANDKALSESAG